MQHNLIGFELSAQQKICCERYGSGGVAQFALRLTGELAIDRLKLAIERLVGRHEVLRTTYQRSSGMRYPVQVVSESTAIGWSKIDLAGKDEATQARELAALLSDGEVDPAESPACRVFLITLAGTQNVVAFRLSALSADQQTLHNLVNELSELYSAAAALGDDPLQYADYAQWQADLSAGSEHDPAATEYWDKEDWAALAQVALPFSRKADERLSAATGIFEIPLERPLAGKLNALTADLEPTLLAAWQVTLWRLTRTPRFALGFVSSGRNQRELDGACGLFSRTLPCLAELRAEQSFSDLVKSVQLESGKGQELQDYLNPRLSNSYQPSAGFSAQKRLTNFVSDGLAFSIIDERFYQAQFDLELRCAFNEGSDISLQIVYNPARLWSDGPERIGRALVVLLNAILAAPDTPVGDLPILDAHEQRRMVVEFNPPETPFSGEKCIHHLFEEQAALRPAQPALRCGEWELSFQELNERANQIAHFLRKRGVVGNVPVGLCTDRSVEMIVGLLAILKAGGCYVPLVADQPEQRLLLQLSQTKARIALTQSRLRPKLERAEVEIVCLDGASCDFGAESVANPAWKNQPDDLAYILFTSGSTGTPKGVAVRHSSLVNYSEFIGRRIEAHKYGEGLSFASVSTIGADLGNTSIFPALISGGCLHVVPYETATSSSLFAGYLTRHRVDVLKITPSHLSALLEQSASGAIWPRRFLFLGGESLAWPLLARIRESARCVVINHYGPTEATVGCCTFDTGDDVSGWTPATVPVGRPIANTQIYIVDEKGETVPTGVPGELCVAGAGLAQGYFNDPEQTQARFVANRAPGRDVRIYRTGDLARFLPDGNIEFLGRADHQVKIRGFRVEPAEIERALESHPNVRKAVVLPFGSTGDQQLAAFIVPETAPVAAQLRAFLSERVPDYMIPSQFVALPSMPMNANGKLDLQALSKIREEKTETDATQAEPRTPEEVKLAGIWSEVLKRPCSNIHANFFMLGGHSLLAAQIVSRIRDAFKVQFPLASFLQTPTIAELALKIAQCDPTEQSSEIEQFLATLQNLTEEEAEQLLAEMEREQA